MSASYTCLPVCHARQDNNGLTSWDFSNGTKSLVSSAAAQRYRFLKPCKIYSMLSSLPDVSWKNKNSCPTKLWAQILRNLMRLSSNDFAEVCAHINKNWVTYSIFHICHAIKTSAACSLILMKLFTLLEQANDQLCWNVGDVSKMLERIFNSEPPKWDSCVRSAGNGASSAFTVSILSR